MRIVAAPGRFVGALTAAQAATAIGEGLRAGAPAAEVLEIPMADGGGGSHAVALLHGFAEVPLTVRNATGDPHDTSYAMRGTTAVLELSRLCGAATVPAAPNPWNTSTFGMGEAIADALRRGATDIALCLGGAGSVDGGAGILAALGWQLVDLAGSALPPTLAGLERAAAIRPAASAPEARFVAVCDATIPLVGLSGTARSAGASLGLTGADTERANTILNGWSDLTAGQVGRDTSNIPSSGAAGGAAFAAIAYLGATVENGVDFFAGLTGLREDVRGAAAVITGERLVDARSPGATLPRGVAKVAAQAGVQTYLLCAEDAEPQALDDAFLWRGSLSTRYAESEWRDRIAPLLSEVAREVGAAIGG